MAALDMCLQSAMGESRFSKEEALRTFEVCRDALIKAAQLDRGAIEFVWSDSDNPGQLSQCDKCGGFRGHGHECQNKAN